MRQKFIILTCTLLATTLAYGEKPSSSPAAGLVEAEATETAVSPSIDLRGMIALTNYRAAAQSLMAKSIALQNEAEHSAEALSQDEDSETRLANAFHGIRTVTLAEVAPQNSQDPMLRQASSSMSDEELGSFMTASIIPVLFHEDVHYLRRGDGSVSGRLAFALSRVAVTSRKDSGEIRFNAAEILGNGITGALANAYHPEAMGLGDTMSRMFGQIGSDALTNVVKEFLPDLKRLFSRRHSGDE